MTECRPTNNLPQPNHQPPEPSSQSPEPSSGPALSRPSPVIPAQAGIHTADPQREEMRENGREIQKSSLTFRQQAALTVIAATPTMAQVARQAGIGESTSYRWLEDDHFRVELARIREESADLPRQELQGLMLRGISVIGEVEKLRKEIREVEAALPIWTAHHTLK